MPERLIDKIERQGLERDMKLLIQDSRREAENSGIRLTKEEKAVIEANATRRGLSFSEYARSILLEKGTSKNCS